MTRVRGQRLRILRTDDLAHADLIQILVRADDKTGAREMAERWVAEEVVAGWGDYFPLDHPPVVTAAVEGVWRWMPERDEDEHCMYLLPAKPGPGAFRGFVVDLRQPETD